MLSPITRRSKYIDFDCFLFIRKLGDYLWYKCWLTREKIECIDKILDEMMKEVSSGELKVCASMYFSSCNLKNRQYNFPAYLRKILLETMPLLPIRKQYHFAQKLCQAGQISPILYGKRGFC